jgi:hypothetical protein
MINKLVDLSSDFGFQSVQNSSALQSFLERLICPHAPKELSPPLSTGSPKAFFVQIHRLKTRSNAYPMSRRRTWFMQAFGNSTKLNIKPHEMFWDDYDLFKMMTIYMSHLTMNRSCSEISLIILLDRGFCSPRQWRACLRKIIPSRQTTILSLSLASALLLSRHVFQFLKLEFHTREIVFQDVMLCIKSTNRSVVFKRRSALMMRSLYRKRKRKSSKGHRNGTKKQSAKAQIRGRKRRERERERERERCQDSVDPPWIAMLQNLLSFGEHQFQCSYTLEFFFACRSRIVRS